MPNSPTTSEIWSDKKVLVMGLGLFGGNVSATRYLASLGARIAITDLRDASALVPSLSALDGIPIERLTLTQHLESDIDWADTLLISPAVKLSNPFIKYALSQNKRITTELELFLQACPAHIAAVTGSNGKSTTTTILSRILRATGQNVFLGGNIGHSLLDDLNLMTPDAWIALEVSSFQLAWLPADLLRPEVAILTNLSPNHLDWHPDFNDYSLSKSRLFSNAKHTVLPESLPANWPTLLQHPYRFALQDLNTPGAFLTRDSTLLTRRAGVINPLCLPFELSLPGQHNTLNALAALSAGLALNLDLPEMLSHLADLKALPQRLESIATHNGLTFINDSAATTPESTLEALRSIQGPLHLIIGGSDKGSDFTTLAGAIASRCDSIALIGHLAPRLESLIREHLAAKPTPLASHPDLPSAFTWSTQQANTLPATLLLSPAAASFGLYLNYEQRGHHFNQLVQDHLGEQSSL